MDNVAKGLAPVYLYLLRKLQMKLSSTRSFKPFRSLALERRTISLFIPTRLEYDFPGIQVTQVLGIMGLNKRYVIQ